MGTVLSEVNYSGWDQEYDLDIVPTKVPWWRRVWEWMKEQ